MVDLTVGKLVLKLVVRSASHLVEWLADSSALRWVEQRADWKVEN